MTTASLPRRRPTSHRKIAPMPVWQTVALSIAAAAVLTVFAFGMIAVILLVVAL